MSELDKKMPVISCFVFGFSILLAACFEEPPKYPSKNPSFYSVEYIIKNDALNEFVRDYAEAPENKAFAQSDSGAWGWQSSRTSKEHAIQSALTDCQSKNKEETTKPCKLMNVNGSWLSAVLSR